MEIAEINEESRIDIANMHGGTEYRFLTHIWYYGSIPTWHDYLRYDKSLNLDFCRTNYNRYLDKVLQGKYGFKDYDEVAVYKAAERVYKRGRYRLNQCTKSV